MAILLVIAFIAVPLVEIWVFIQVGSVIGAWPTVALCVLTAVLGAALVRFQGLGALAKAKAALERDELPVEAIFEGLCLLAAGALLLTPGFVTDTIGFALLIPALRGAAGRWLWRFLQARGMIHVQGGTGPGGRHAGPGETVIEGEWQDVTPDHGKQSGGSGSRRRLSDRKKNPWSR